jgi:hypothetical protein
MVFFQALGLRFRRWAFAGLEHVCSLSKSSGRAGASKRQGLRRTRGNRTPLWFQRAMPKTFLSPAAAARRCNWDRGVPDGMLTPPGQCPCHGHGEAVPWPGLGSRRQRGWLQQHSLAGPCCGTCHGKWRVHGTSGVGGICKPVWANRLPASLEAWLIRNQSRFWSFVEDLMTMVAARCGGMPVATWPSDSPDSWAVAKTFVRILVRDTFKRNWFWIPLRKGS